ncbi:hypothetical protein M9H77_23814 [Catharanthus roseus]|uniref:Uncharacterized protein n=1 Tax=Catharanthus roseus TaxID=4058 RepID=A0ACC0AV54_CATRO|nr:hypothetical protein M9H77_23814 [Catharanthus roseus]
MIGLSFSDHHHHCHFLFSFSMQAYRLSPLVANSSFSFLLMLHHILKRRAICRKERKKEKVFHAQIRLEVAAGKNPIRARAQADVKRRAVKLSSRLTKINCRAQSRSEFELTKKLTSRARLIYIPSGEEIGACSRFSFQPFFWFVLLRKRILNGIGKELGFLWPVDVDPNILKEFSKLDEYVDHIWKPKAIVDDEDEFLIKTHGLYGTKNLQTIDNVHAKMKKERMEGRIPIEEVLELTLSEDKRAT